MTLHRLSNGKTVLFLMATEAEYQTELKKLINPIVVGVGPVEAAINTIAHLNAMPQKPDYVIALGSSGSATLPQGNVYQATSVSYRDMDASPLGFEKGATPFTDLPIHLTLTPIIDGIEGATLSTGGDIVLADEFANLEEQIVDMESYAIKRACMQFDIPLIVLRGISDGAEKLSQYSDWSDVLELIDQNLAKSLEKTLSALERS